MNRQRPPKKRTVVNACIAVSPVAEQITQQWRMAFLHLPLPLAIKGCENLSLNFHVGATTRRGEIVRCTAALESRGMSLSLHAVVVEYSRLVFYLSVLLLLFQKWFHVVLANQSYQDYYIRTGGVVGAVLTASLHGSEGKEKFSNVAIFPLISTPHSSD